MRKLIRIVCSVTLFSSAAFGDCDFSKVVKNNDGTFTYSKDLHICVGQLVQDNTIKAQQIDDLNKAISLKDLTIQKSDERANLWMDTSFKLESRVETIDKMEKTNSWLFFALGAVTVIGAGMMAAQLSHR